MEELVEYVAKVVAGGNASAADLATFRAKLEERFGSACASVAPVPKPRAKPKRKVKPSLEGE